MIIDEPQSVNNTQNVTVKPGAGLCVATNKRDIYEGYEVAGIDTMSGA